MRPKICKDNGVNIPTSDCSTCEILEQKVDALTEALDEKQNVLTAGDYIEIEEDVISADLSDFYDKTTVDMLLNGVTAVEFQVVSALPETGDGNVVYLVPNGDTYEQYVYTNETWTNIGGTSETYVRNVYPVDGAEEYTAGWLSYTSGGSAFTPSEGVIYVLLQGTETSGTGDLIRWNGTQYKVVSDNGVIKGSYHSATQGRIKWEGNRLDPVRPLLSLTLGTDGTLTSELDGTQITEYASTANIASELTRRVPKAVRTYSGTLATLTSMTSYDSSLGAETATTAFNNCTCIGLVTATFDANATGDRLVGATLNEGTAINSGAKIRAASTGVTVISVPIITRMSANDHLRFEVWQNSGSNLNVTIAFRGIFIDD